MNKSKVIMSALLGASLSMGAFASEFDLDGFTTKIEDGRLWVFEAGSENLAFFEKHGEPAKQFSNIGAGPNGMTLKAASQETLDSYIKAMKK
ncbi:MAG: hypothetical protein ABJN96_00765 [Marinomonas sp.]|uniref:hypothetical protein n=1 Tax=unclassified Marinomonas TaxID=196814 RepID=UPI0029352ADF|nr:hypothetical protein [Marinomonas sp. GJ51-6]WOD07968.1 hypothetical protein ONZ50_02010 [Marinomonas sp. GJ51-6]